MTRSNARGSLVALCRERGFSLIVSLMMLIVIILLGVGAAQMAVNEERGSRNDRDRQIAFQAAEAAIKDAEQEIFGPASPTCSVTGQVNRGKQRGATITCFNALNVTGYAVGCSAPPSAGLCSYNQALPAYLDSANVDFVKDATSAAGANNHTVAYGTFTSRSYGSQETLGATSPVSIHPPRYIIEAVPKNTAVDTLSNPGAGQMFRITAMGFGPTINAQVVLQAVVSTQD